MSIATLELTATYGGRPQSVGISWRRLWRSISARDAVLLAARTGRWRWPWALLSTVLATVGIGLAIGVSGILMGLVTGSVPFADDKMLDPQQPSSFLIMLVMFLPLIFVPCLLMRYLHKVSWRHLIASSGRFEWPIFLRAAAAFFVVTAAMVALDYATDPGAYQLLHRRISFVPWLVLGLAVIFVQTLAEEILFRGYLLRMWGAVLPYRVLTTSMVMAVFISGHLGNADLESDFWFNVIGFALTQAVWSYMWFRTQSVAACAGLHWANNVLVFFIIATVPGQSTAMAIASTTDAVLARGGSHLLDPSAWAMMLFGLGLLVMLLVWRRSPFYLPIRSCAVAQ